MGIIVEQWKIAGDGERIDLGWAWASFDADAMTLTRVCKGCGASATSPCRRKGDVLEVERRAISHADACEVWLALSLGS